MDQPAAASSPAASPSAPAVPFPTAPQTGHLANLSRFYESAPGDIMGAHIDGIYDIRAKVV